MREKDDVELSVRIDGKYLALQPFVQRIVRKTLLTMLSTLKDTEIKGDEKVEIEVRRAAT